MENKIELQPIPQQEHYVCTTCGSTHVSTVGNQVLCQNCVNNFLARNVGLMRPVSELKAEEEAKQRKASVEEAAEELAKRSKKRLDKVKPKKPRATKGGTG